MRQQLRGRFTNRCDVVRHSETGELNEANEPVMERLTVEEDVRCMFDDGRTTFVRTDSGERLQRPASVWFEPGRDVQEGDEIHMTRPDFDDVLEVRQINTHRDHVRGGAVSIQAEVESVG